MKMKAEERRRGLETSLGTPGKPQKRGESNGTDSFLPLSEATNPEETLNF